MEHAEEFTLTYSCILTKGKERIVRVSIEGKGKYAEGIVPDGTITRQKGFEKEELEQITIYLKRNQQEIFNKAKEITGMQHWFR